MVIATPRETLARIKFRAASMPWKEMESTPKMSSEEPARESDGCSECYPPQRILYRISGEDPYIHGGVGRQVSIDGDVEKGQGSESQQQQSKQYALQNPHGQSPCLPTPMKVVAAPKLLRNLRAYNTG